ncbi:hypothetical protein POL68_33845 [Stigmatella sp. ncwal1]|uniref:Uncharacterized protein n=1 Tax=Stigmatella ashevillensis TaxID=2995309 RepID=A0ABT5DIM5_9BACT|nr:hypothetical protein [Stigmatella ashevillena]MDC0713497.1 hypothetical protein [Stigmatella ashevillena]
MREKYYFNLPGNMTGDIWHLAAAMSLNQHFGDGVKTLKAVIGVVKTSTGKGKYEERSPSLFDFLLALGLPVSEVEVPVENRRPGVAASYTKGEMDEIIAERLSRVELGKYAVQAVIDQRISTTILMHYVKEKGKAAVVAYLQQKFTEGLPLPDRQVMDAKVLQIRKAIQDHGGKRVVLLNRRTGDLNKQHNTTDGIEAQIESLAEQKGMFVMGIATPLGKPGDIDLFGSAFKGKSKQEFVDKRRTAYFWKEVSQIPEVHGLIGGRSGSMDIAAFMGVNVFSWDEYNSRDEQVLRLLQTYPLMSIGFVDEKTKNKEGSYEKLDHFPLNIWMTRGQYNTKRPSRLEERHIQGLEGGGFRAHYLRDPQ